ncbi:hypothetical protein BpHYR1_042517 [Brachionus plicatilis]|uniref:Uncharacterized protein n=1 Tax=Brachionus plicatilis TaxID=10195 RepID=A0A3M7PHG0_BRAPC|nr:hypothetical protein BpHYR1_042517 [Brachionus plicatilis]
MQSNDRYKYGYLRILYYISLFYFCFLCQKKSRPKNLKNQKSSFLIPNSRKICWKSYNWFINWYNLKNWSNIAEI